ncbi:rhomboid family protein [Planoprotostelium fungivorum]|uniref:rhomboid protease n=1 Tax=Planoprotostelium fungivorum TaxID=1890364 RepID=A0A2P6NDS1_9EUKA|nr:rhomboid family protein [Planoprotostelium fungivorum]
MTLVRKKTPDFTIFLLSAPGAYSLPHRRGVYHYHTHDNSKTYLLNMSQPASPLRQLSRTFSAAALDFLGLNNRPSAPPQDEEHGQQPYWMANDYWQDEGYPSDGPQHQVEISVTASHYANQRVTIATPAESELMPESPPSYSEFAPRNRAFQRTVSHERFFKEATDTPSKREEFAGRGRGRGRGRGGVSRNVGPRVKGKAAPKYDPTPHEIVEHFPYFIILVTIIDLIIVIFEIVVNQGIESFSVNPWAGPNVQTLIDLGAKDASLMQAGQWWRFFTPIFMHVGLIHFALNMMMQVYTGRSLEKMHGAVRIVPIYLLCGIFGNIASSVFLPQQIQVGASGALFGFEGVLLVDLVHNWSRLASPFRNLLSLVVSIVISFLLGILLPGVDNFCHLGGLIMGVVSGFLFLPALGTGTAAARKRVFVVCITITLVILLIGGGLIIFYTTNATRWCPFCSKITCLEVLPWCSGNFKL